MNEPTSDSYFNIANNITNMLRKLIAELENNKEKRKSKIVFYTF